MSNSASSFPFRFGWGEPHFEPRGEGGGTEDRHEYANEDGGGGVYRAGKGRGCSGGEHARSVAAVLLGGAIFWAAVCDLPNLNPKQACNRTAFLVPLLVKGT